MGHSSYRRAIVLILWGTLAPSWGQLPPSPDAALEQALQEWEAGRVAGSRALLEEIIEQWPNFKRAHYHLGRLALDRGEIETAHSHLEVAAAGDFPRAFSASYQLGRTRILLRDFEGAIEALNEALERAPRFSLAMLERGRAWLFLGETDKGSLDLRTSVETTDPPRQALWLLSQLAIEENRTEEALQWAGQLRERSVDEDRWQSKVDWLGMAAEGDLRSRRDLRLAIESHPDAAEVYWSLAMAERSVDPQRAQKLLRVALDQDSENPVTLLSLEQSSDEPPDIELPKALPRLRAASARAVRLWEEGRWEESREIATRLLESGRILVPARLLLAGDAERRGDLWQAAWEYQRLLEWLGPVPGFARRLAEIAQTMRADELAECSITMAQEADPGNGAIAYVAAVIAMNRDDSEIAIQRFRAALALGYEDAKTWLRLGELYFEQMKIEESIGAYERAMAIDPGAAEAVRSFALSSLTTEQYQSLRAILEAHLERHPNNINTLYSLGVMSLRDGDLEAARKHFLRLAEVAPEHRQVHYNLGQIYLRQGESEAGHQEMEEFRQIRAREDEEWERHNQAHRRRIEARRHLEDDRPDLAIPLYSQSIAEGTAELPDYQELAEAHLAAGSLEEASKGYRGILSSHPYNRAALEGELETARLLGDDRLAAYARDRIAVLDWNCKMETIH
jgi:tetratricopeptide (TPR) repeat protein